MMKGTSWVMAGCLVLTVCMTLVSYSPRTEPIVSQVDLYFGPTALKVSPGGNPHVGDVVEITAEIASSGLQKWTKWGVVLDRGNPGDGDSLEVNSPNVMYDAGQYKMWYAGTPGGGYGDIFYATSNDGIAWTKHGAVLHYGPPGEDINVHWPFVMNENSTFKMWYTGYDGSHYRIFYATSPDGVTWTRQGMVMDVGPPGSYDDLFIYAPFVLHEGPTYKMWYSGDDGLAVRLMLATSPDGITWTKQGIALDRGPPGSLDWNLVSPGFILKEGGGYHLWYRGHDGVHNRILYATSDDAVNWTRRGLAIDIGPPGSTDAYHLLYQSIIHLPGMPYQLWYAGRGGPTGIDRIHYANLTAFALPMDVDVNFYLDSIVPGSLIGSATAKVGTLSTSMAKINWTAKPAGDHKICAMIDPLDKIAEWDETNNTACIDIKILGIPPIADAGPDVSILEGQVATLDGSGSYDPNGRIENYSWDLDVIVDSDGDGDPTNDVDSWGPVVSKMYGDDGLYCAELTVTDNDSLKDSDIACVNVTNIAPTATVYTLNLEVNVTLRVAGRKWNQVGMEFYENDTLMVNVTITRMPGSPDSQAKIVGVSLNMLANHTAIVSYVPNETAKGGIGGNPVWIILSADGKEKRLHHTFNVQQSIERNSSHWNHVEPWIVDINTALVGFKMKVSIEASDPGSDDIIFEWSTGEKCVFYNNGLSPDLPHSPEGLFPFVVKTVMDITYPGPGVSSLTTRDDDGGSSVISLHI